MQALIVVTIEKNQMLRSLKRKRRHADEILCWVETWGDNYLHE